MLNRLRIAALSIIGRLSNAAGVPGFIKDCDYNSRQLGTTVRVRRGQFFTVVTVNGIDVFFNRFGGEIDGVGFSPASDCRQGGAPLSIGSAAQPGSAHGSRIQSPPDCYE